MEIHERLRATREDKDITQEQAARAANCTKDNTSGTKQANKK